MKQTRSLLILVSMISMAVAASAQGLDPALLTKPATDSWPTYSGDYSGRRFSSLTQINQSNVKNLGLAWVSHLEPGAGAADRVLGAAPWAHLRSLAVKLRNLFLCAAPGASPVRSCK